MEWRQKMYARERGVKETLWRKSAITRGKAGEKTGQLFG